MTAYRLRPEHATAKKVQQVFDLMEKLGLSFTAESNGRGNIFIVTDRDQEFPAPLELVDLDDPNDGDVSSLPPVFDFKLRYGHK
jgi:hypothetical protein